MAPNSIILRYHFGNFVQGLTRPSALRFPNPLWNVSAVSEAGIGKFRRFCPKKGGQIFHLRSYVYQSGKFDEGGQAHSEIIGLERDR